MTEQEALDCVRNIIKKRNINLPLDKLCAVELEYYWAVYPYSGLPSPEHRTGDTVFLVDHNGKIFSAKIQESDSKDEVFVEQLADAQPGLVQKGDSGAKDTDLPPRLELREPDGYLLRDYSLRGVPCVADVADRMTEVELEIDGALTKAPSRKRSLEPRRQATLDDLPPLLENYPGVGEVRRSYSLQGARCISEVADKMEEKIVFSRPLPPDERLATVRRKIKLVPMRAARGDDDFLPEESIDINTSHGPQTINLDSSRGAEDMLYQLAVEAIQAGAEVPIMDQIPGTSYIMVRTYWSGSHPCLPAVADCIQQVIIDNSINVIGGKNLSLKSREVLSEDTLAPEVEKGDHGYITRSYFVNDQPCVAAVADTCIERLSLSIAGSPILKTIQRTATIVPLRAATEEDIKESNHYTEVVNTSGQQKLEMMGSLMTNIEEALDSGRQPEAEAIQLLLYGWDNVVSTNDKTPEREARVARIRQALGD